MSPDTLAAEPAVGSAGPLRFLPLAIRVPRRPFLAIAAGWLTAFLPTAAMTLIIALVATDIATPQFPFDGAEALWRLVVLAPVLETLIMGAVMLVLLQFISPVAAIFASAIGWGIAHSLMVPIWGLVIWWPFLVFSTLFVTWRSRSLVAAFMVPASAHALQNLIPALQVAYGQPA